MKKIDRIIKYLENEGVSLSEFERLAQLGYSYLGKTKKRGGEISDKSLAKIRDNAPDYYFKIFPEESENQFRYYGGEQKNNSLLSEIEKLKSEIETLKIRLKDKEDVIESKQSLIEFQKADIERLNKENNDLLLAKAALITEKDELEKRIDLLMQEVDKLRRSA